RARSTRRVRRGDPPGDGRDQRARAVPAAGRCEPEGFEGDGESMRFLAAIVGSSLLLTGCTAVKVRPTDPHRYAEQRRSNVLDGGGLSASTRESLRIPGLPEKDCQSQPLPCLRRLQAGPGLDEERRLAALAELWLEEAAAHDSDKLRTALDDYLEAARASY